MMIPILKDYYHKGYLPPGDEHSWPAYLPNANLAIRRVVIEQIGGYDNNCSAGEDADLCLRASRAGWDLFYEPRAKSFHEARRNLFGVIRQWNWYGDGGSFFFSKQQRKRLEIFINLELTPKMHRYRKVFATRWFPIRSMFFISYFQLAHLTLLLLTAGIWIGWYKPTLFFGLAAAIILLKLWRRSPLRKLSFREICIYGFVTYIINWTCLFSSIWGGLKHCMLFMYPGV